MTVDVQEPDELELAVDQALYENRGPIKNEDAWRRAVARNLLQDRSRLDALLRRRASRFERVKKQVLSQPADRSRWSDLRLLYTSYEALVTEVQQQVDHKARQVAEEEVQQLQISQGVVFTPDVLECQLRRLRQQAWERLVRAHCEAEIRQLVATCELEDGASHRLEWALMRTERQREPGYQKPRTIKDLIQRLAKGMEIRK